MAWFQLTPRLRVYRKRALVVLAVGAIVSLPIALIVLSLQKINSDQIGIQYDLIQRTLYNEIREEGLHIGPVGYRFVKFPSIYKSINFDDLVCLNADGVDIYLDVSFQYRINVDAIYRIALEFKDHEGYEDVLRIVAESAIHEACSLFRTYEFPSARGNFTAQIRDYILLRFRTLECQVNDVQVNDLRRPEAYDVSVTEKERAREEIQVVFNQRPRKLTEASTAKHRAEFAANVTVARALSDAQILHTQAVAEAESIRTKYEKEAETYAEIIGDSGLNFTTEGFLSYLGIRMISDAHNPVFVGLQSPVKSSFTQP